MVVHGVICSSAAADEASRRADELALTLPKQHQRGGGEC